MEARGRRRHTAVHRGVDRLVALPIGGLRRSLDVRRERHRAIALHQSGGVQPAREAQPPQAPSHHVYDLGLAVVAEAHPAPHLELAARVHHGEPGSVGLGVDQQDLGLAPALAPGSQPGRNHPARVEHQHVAWLEHVGEIAEVSVGDGAALTVEHEQPAGSPLRQGVLSDGLARELVVEVGSAEPVTHLADRRTSTPERRPGTQAA